MQVEGMFSTIIVHLAKSSFGILNGDFSLLNVVLFNFYCHFGTGVLFLLRKSIHCTNIVILPAYIVVMFALSLF